MSVFDDWSRWVRFSAASESMITVSAVALRRKFRVYASEGRIDHAFLLDFF